MKDILNIRHANDFAKDVGSHIYHPLVSVIHFDELGKIRTTLNKLSVYAIFVQDNFPTDAKYGLGRYDTSKGTLTAASPGQIIGKEDDGHLEEYHGWALFFDADFMRGTVFEQRLADYHFFSYNVNEALHTTQGEKELMWRLMEMIRRFIQHREQNPLNDRIVQDYIVLVCDYCLLFYQRQFKDSTNLSNDMLAKFYKVLNDYYEKRMHLTKGLPNVKYCASELCLSPSYFGDVLRSVTGDSPAFVIRQFLVERAKTLMASGLTVKQVADELGFEYPQHFTRFFKKQTGMLPSKYVSSMLDS